MKSIEGLQESKNKMCQNEKDEKNELKKMCAFFGVTYLIDDLEKLVLIEYIKMIEERLKNENCDPV